MIVDSNRKISYYAPDNRKKRTFNRTPSTTGKMAADLMLIRQQVSGRNLCCATGRPLETAGVKDAAGSRFIRGYISFEDNAFPVPENRVKGAGQQGLGIGMAGPLKELRCRGLLHDATQVHDRNSAADPGGKAEVMGDEKEGHPVLFPHLNKEFRNLFRVRVSRAARGSSRKRISGLAAKARPMQAR
ncbi:MAG: hypothetical protein V8K32_12815 [Candidatus Electrothrix gigas]